jgi:hypothetical protein
MISTTDTPAKKRKVGAVASTAKKGKTAEVKPIASL